MRSEMINRAETEEAASLGWHCSCYNSAHSSQVISVLCFYLLLVLSSEISKQRVRAVLVLFNGPTIFLSICEYSCDLWVGRELEGGSRRILYVNLRCYCPKVKEDEVNRTYCHR